MKQTYNKINYFEALEFALQTTRKYSDIYNEQTYNTNTTVCNSIKKLCKHDITVRLYCIMLLKNLHAERAEILSILNISESKYKYTTRRFTTVIKNKKSNCVLNNRLNTHINNKAPRPSLKNNKPVNMIYDGTANTISDDDNYEICIELEINETVRTLECSELNAAKKELKLAWNNLKDRVKSLFTKWS